MRKIGIVFAVVFVVSWMFSLFCMRAAGQAGGRSLGENGNVVSGETISDGQAGMERSVSGQVADWSLNGEARAVGKQVGGTAIPTVRIRGMENLCQTQMCRGSR